MIERLQEQELEDKKMHSLSIIPPMMDPEWRTFTDNNGLVADPARFVNDHRFPNEFKY